MQGAASLLFAARTVVEIATSSFDRRVALIYADDNASRILLHLVRAMAPETPVFSTEGKSLIEKTTNKTDAQIFRLVHSAQSEARRLDAELSSCGSPLGTRSDILLAALRDFDACLYHPATLRDGLAEPSEVVGFAHGRLAFAPLMHWRADEIADYAATLPVPERVESTSTVARRTAGPRLAFSHGRAVKAS